MLKFKFHYLHNTLAIHQEGNIWHERDASQQFESNFGGIGFKLEGGWISFTLYEKKIRTFYKHFDTPTWFTHYRKDLPREAPIIFTFTDADQVEKVNGKWTKKEEANHA